MSQALIFANGEIADGIMVRRALDAAQNPLVVAADGGARVAQHFGCALHVVIGDMDSLTPDELDNLAKTGTEIRQHPREKDQTDLELALHYVCARGADWIRIIGGLGGRIDQTLGNIYLLALPELVGRDVRLVADKQETRLLLPGDYVVIGAPGDTISLIPIGGAVHGVRTEDLYYPLDNETLDLGPARGISNVMNGEAARVSLRSGILLLVHTVGRA